MYHPYLDETSKETQAPVALTEALDMALVMNL